MLPSQAYRQPDPGAVLTALHEIASRHGYLPADALRQAAAELGVPLSQMFSAATFYAAFSFTPCGRHKIHVCEGTACYVKGSPELLARLRAELGVEPDETTADLAFTLKRVRCVGSCGLAPVVRVDGDTYGQLTPNRLEAVLANYR
jgi:NADH-quinone oxidoreductase subunit E/NADP-reducing hydrogenase subunit HndA